MEEAFCQAYNKCFVASYEMDLDVTKSVFLINYGYVHKRLALLMDGCCRYSYKCKWAN